MVFFDHVSLLSLENFSDKIRWSMDLRWQRPDKPNGFYGLKVSSDMTLNGNRVPEILIFIALKNRQYFFGLMSFNLHKKLLFTLRINLYKYYFVLLFSRTASYCARQRIRLMQWTGLSLHHVTDIYYNNLMRT